jgi:hypothetical protein
MAGRTVDLSSIPAFDAEEQLTFRRKIPSCDGNSVDIRCGETLKTSYTLAVARENLVQQVFRIFGIVPPRSNHSATLSCALSSLASWLATSGLTPTAAGHHF